MSSSIAVVVPSLEAAGLLYSRLGKTILSATIFEDILSLLLLSLLLQSVSPVTKMPLSIFLVVLILSLVILRWAIPKIEGLMERVGPKAGFEYDIRSVSTILLGTVIVFQLLGLHSITAGFFAGLLLSDSIKQEITKQKLHAISYGLFIPIFFIIIGSKTNLGVFAEAEGAFLLTAAILLGSITSKFERDGLAAN